MNDVKAKLKAWILARNPAADPASLTDETALITQKFISSVQMLDLILYMENIGANELDPEKLTPQSFASINSIVKNFF